MRKALAVLAVLAALTGVTGCGSSDDEPIVVNRDSFSAIVGDWPLTVDSAEVACGVKNAQSVGITVNGKTYSMNGTAKSFESWPELDRLWAANPDIPGGKIDIGDLIDFAHRHCDAR